MLHVAEKASLESDWVYLLALMALMQCLLSQTAVASLQPTQGSRRSTLGQQVAEIQSLRLIAANAPLTLQAPAHRAVQANRQVAQSLHRPAIQVVAVAQATQAVRIVHRAIHRHRIRQAPVVQVQDQRQADVLGSVCLLGSSLGQEKETGLVWHQGARAGVRSLLALAHTTVTRLEILAAHKQCLIGPNNGMQQPEEWTVHGSQ